MDSATIASATPTFASFGLGGTDPASELTRTILAPVWHEIWEYDSIEKYLQTVRDRLAKELPN